MGSIGRYIFRTTFGAFLVICASVTALMWITQALRDIDLMTNQGQSIFVFVGLTAYDTQRIKEMYLEGDGEVIAGKKAIALRMGKEVLTRSVEVPGLDAALALERNAIQWLNNAPDTQAALAGLRQNPDALVQSQRAANVGSDQNG